MLGYNERQEAENLLILLQRAGDVLPVFNARDGQIAALMGICPQDGAALADALLTWYLNLALWEERERCSGCYSLCFTSEKEAQAHPYNLLARLPLKASETMMADVPEALFTGLDAPERQAKKRLYLRLLRVEPMRRLLARLYELARMARDCAGRTEAEIRQRLLEKIGSLRWRSPIPLLMERDKGTSLDLNDNEFTILDRMIDNHNRPLREEPTVSLPGWLMESTTSAPALLTAAIAYRTDADPQKRGCVQYRALPGGHTALGLYGEGTLDNLFRNACRDQNSRQGKRIFHVRHYSRFRLVQLTQRTRTGLMTAEGAGVSGCLPPPIVPPERDWRDALAKLQALEAPAPHEAAWVKLPDGQAVLRVPDNGGNGAYRALTAAVSRRKAAAKTEKKAQRNVSNSEYGLTEALLNFFRGRAVTPEQRVQAMENLHAVVAAVFAAGKIPAKLSSEQVRAISNSSGAWELRALRLLLSWFSLEKLRVLRCELGQIPPELEACLCRLRNEENTCEAFRRYCCDAELERKCIYVYARYTPVVTPQGRGHELLMNALPTLGDTPLRRWLESNGTEMPAFAGTEFARLCRHGLMRHLYRQWNVGKDDESPFRLVPGTAMTQAPDKCFHLACAAFLLQRAIPKAKLEKNCEDPAGSCLRAGNERVPFVEVIERMSAFTPEEWLSLSGQARRIRLRIIKGSCDEVSISDAVP